MHLNEKDISAMAEFVTEHENCTLSIRHRFKAPTMIKTPRGPAMVEAPMELQGRCAGTTFQGRGVAIDSSVDTAHGMKQKVVSHIPFADVMGIVVISELETVKTPDTILR